MLRVDAALAAAQTRGRPAALEFFKHLLHSTAPAPGLCFRPKCSQGLAADIAASFAPVPRLVLGLGPLPGRADAFQAIGRGYRKAAGALQQERRFLAAVPRGVDVDAAQEMRAGRPAVEMVGAVTAVALDPGEDDLDALVGRHQHVTALNVTLRRAPALDARLQVAVDDQRSGVAAVVALPVELPFAGEVLRHR